MQCPEVWNFKEPETIFKSHVVDPDDKSCFSKIRSFHYNHLASVVLPDTLRVPQSLTDTLNTDCDYYKISELNAADLVNEDFLTCFVKSGQLTLLSINTRIDCDSCLCITPLGHLILNVDKETYQALGLEGKVSHFHSKVKSRYTIDVNLGDAKFCAGSYLHERTKLALGKLPKLTVIFIWKPPQSDICPSSIANFLDKDYNVKLCKLQHNSDVLYSVKVPQIDDLKNLHEDDVADIVEWLGMICLNGDLEENSEDVYKSYLSTYEIPQPHIETGQVRFLQWKGLFTFEDVESLIEETRNYVKSLDKSWAAIHIQGFSDSPVAWSHEEHHYYTSGDNGYVLLIKSDKMLIFTQECSKKKYK